MPRFQSTPPCGGDLVPGKDFRGENDFNPRPLAGATKLESMGGRQTAISIHAPLRGRHSLSAQPKQKQSFQSTPPCGGDAYLLRTGGAPAISIHAPLRGRHKIKAGVLTADISIHAPLRGRPLMLELENFMEYFNPRPLAGATDGRIWGGRSGNISIHAPLRGRRGRGIHQ